MYFHVNKTPAKMPGTVVQAFKSSACVEAGKSVFQGQPGLPSEILSPKEKQNKAGLEISVQRGVNK